MIFYFNNTGISDLGLFVQKLLYKVRLYRLCLCTYLAIWGGGGANNLTTTAKQLVFFAFSCSMMANETLRNLQCGNFILTMGARNRVGIGLSYWPARLNRLADPIFGIDSWAP